MRTDPLDGTGLIAINPTEGMEDTAVQDRSTAEIQVKRHALALPAEPTAQSRHRTGQADRTVR